MALKAAKQKLRALCEAMLKFEVACEKAGIEIKRGVSTSPGWREEHAGKRLTNIHNVLLGGVFNTNKKTNHPSPIEFYLLYKSDFDDPKQQTNLAFEERKSNKGVWNITDIKPSNNSAGTPQKSTKYGYRDTGSAAYEISTLLKQLRAIAHGEENKKKKKNYEGLVTKLEEIKQLHIDFMAEYHQKVNDKDKKEREAIKEELLEVHKELTDTYGTIEKIENLVEEAKGPSPSSSTTIMLKELQLKTYKGDKAFFTFEKGGKLKREDVEKIISEMNDNDVTKVKYHKTKDTIIYRFQPEGAESTVDITIPRHGKPIYHAEVNQGDEEALKAVVDIALELGVVRIDVTGVNEKDVDHILNKVEDEEAEIIVIGDAGELYNGMKKKEELNMKVKTEKQPKVTSGKTYTTDIESEEEEEYSFSDDEEEEEYSRKRRGEVKKAKKNTGAGVGDSNSPAVHPPEEEDEEEKQTSSPGLGSGSGT